MTIILNLMQAMETRNDVGAYRRNDLFDIVHQPIVLGAGQLTVLVSDIDALLEILRRHIGFTVKHLIE